MSLLAYNDFLVQCGHSSTIDFCPVGIPQEHNENIRINSRLINSLFCNQENKTELSNIAYGLSEFSSLNFYTDGSFDDNTTEGGFPMGYGWTTSNLPNVNFTYNGSIQYFPSSTKAETMAILTCLAVCSPSCKVQIYTDSQAAIDTFHKSKNLFSISPRRFNKINNNILWSSIHHLIRELKLVVRFNKVKAHSHDQFNDRADALAKVGRLQPIPTQINQDHLPHQTLTLKWNDEIPLDKDVRKSIATKDNLIDWSLSAKWFDFNGRNDTTTITHSKDTKWKIRCSTSSLPTKDILH
ncbi:ribonuclease H-like protein [Rhizophagus irregularis]|uniref:Ribonuclease H-like protein n=1 Tax=Rhizophagus irregularis TaxID=588596 RepID=A0A2N1NBB6_9GLOM|nr:ribonuclease H-like protein [Rhizophagus irregularis]